MKAEEAVIYRNPWEELYWEDLQDYYRFHRPWIVLAATPVVTAGVLSVIALVIAGFLNRSPYSQDVLLEFGAGTALFLALALRGPKRRLLAAVFVLGVVLVVAAGFLDLYWSGLFLTVGANMMLYVALEVVLRRIYDGLQEMLSDLHKESDRILREGWRRPVMPILGPDPEGSWLLGGEYPSLGEIDDDEGE